MSVRISPGYLKSLHELSRQVVRELVAATKAKNANAIARKRKRLTKGERA